MSSAAVSRRAWPKQPITLAVVNGAIVFVGLALFITVLYVAIVSVGNALLGPRGQLNVGLSVLAVAVVAIAFQPLRERLQMAANRLVYGERATPYEAMAGLSRRLGSALSADEVLPRTAEAAARSVGALRSHAILYLSDGQVRRAEWPAGSAAAGTADEVAIHDREERIGAIWVVMPGGGSPGHPALLSDIAVHAAPAFRNMRLTADLQTRLHQVSVRAQEIQASRQRLVAAEQVARVKFQTEVQRGPERQLQVTLEGLGSAEALLQDDTTNAGSILAGLADGASQALNDLRELARTVFPTILSDHGVVPALHDQIRKLSLAAEIEVDQSLTDRRLEPQLELTLYFCGAVALEGVKLQHRREPVVLNLERRDGWIRLTSPSPGPERQEDIRDRVDALGGTVELGPGSSLIVSLPEQGLVDVGSVSPT